MANINISRDAADYIWSKRMARPNVVIYRDIIFAGASAPGAFIFCPKVTVKDKEPNELFTVVGNRYRIPLWIERGILSQMKGDEQFIVALKRGIIKRLEIVKCSAVEKLGSEQRHMG